MLAVIVSIVITINNNTRTAVEPNRAIYQHTSTTLADYPNHCVCKATHVLAFTEKPAADCHCDHLKCTPWTWMEPCLRYWCILHLSRSPSRSHRECQPGGASESPRLLVFDARKYHPLKGRNFSMFYSLLTAWQAPLMPGCFASASRWREKCQFVGMFLTHTAAKPDGFTH